MFRFIVLLVVLVAATNAFVPGRSMVTPRATFKMAAQGTKKEVFDIYMSPFATHVHSYFIDNNDFQIICKHDLCWIDP